MAGPLRWVGALARAPVRTSASRTAAGWRASAPTACAAGCGVGVEPPYAAHAADADGPCFGRAWTALRRPRTFQPETGPLPLTALADDPALGLPTGSDGVARRLRPARGVPAAAAGARRQGGDGAGPGRHRRRARREAEERASSRGGERAAVRGAPGQGRRDPRRAHPAAPGPGTDREVDTPRATSSTSCGGSSRACARLRGEDPQLRHPQLQSGWDRRGRW